MNISSNYTRGALSKPHKVTILYLHFTSCSIKKINEYKANVKKRSRKTVACGAASPVTRDLDENRNMET